MTWCFSTSAASLNSAMEVTCRACGYKAYTDLLQMNEFCGTNLAHLEVIGKQLWTWSTMESISPLWSKSSHSQEPNTCFNQDHPKEKSSASLQSEMKTQARMRRPTASQLPPTAVLQPRTSVLLDPGRSNIPKFAKCKVDGSTSPTYINTEQMLASLRTSWVQVKKWTNTSFKEICRDCRAGCKVQD